MSARDTRKVDVIVPGEVVRMVLTPSDDSPVSETVWKNDSVLELWSIFSDLVGMRPGDSISSHGLAGELMMFVDLVCDSRRLLRVRQKHGPAAQERMRSVLNGVKGRTTVERQKSRKLAAEIATIEDAANSYALDNAWAAHSLMIGLRQSTPEYAALKEADVESALRRLVAARSGARKGKRKGDAVSAVGIAVDLACSVGAHGFRTRAAARDAYLGARDWLSKQNALGGIAP